MGQLLIARERNPQPLPVVLPARFADARLANLPEGLLKDTTREYMINFWDAADQGLAPVFLGRAREWKTYAAAVIARLVSPYLDTVFVTVPEAATMLTLARFEDRTKGLLDRWRTVPFLVMDDFAVVQPNSFPAQVMLDVTSARFNAELPTLWTGNLSCEPKAFLPTVTSLYGPLFARRLQDGGAGFTVVLS